MKIPSLIVIGSSTGGPDALAILLKDIRLPCSIIIVQHMMKFINESMRETIERNSGMLCVIPKTGEEIKSGIIYLAPSESHLEVASDNSIQLVTGEQVNYVCPSIDVTMKSLSEDSRVEKIGIVLTGMGRDGADGIAHMKRIGGITIAQEPAASNMPYMPEAAIKTGSVDMVLGLHEIRKYLISRYL
ncbi:MAG: CheB methylesterase domain-containing protein [Bdellovibrionota bacterium]